MRLLVLFLIGVGGLTAFPAETRRVDFLHDVQPILVARCAGCHGGEKPQAGLSVHTRADLLKGGQGGPAIVPGKSKESPLIQRVSGFRAPVMPFGAEPLSEREITILRDWIDQGAPLGDAAPAAKWMPRLAPRRPAVPEATIRGSANPVDHFVADYFQKHGLTAPAPLSDAGVARRAYLDVWGLLPTPVEWEEFVRDAQPGKNDRLADKLLANNKNYAEHWISFWNDLLRNDEGVNYAGVRQSITPWLLAALEADLPYDQFARDLLDPRGPADPTGFLIGVNWRGDVSASQTPPLQAAQNSAQVFLGINLKCNSCHDSFISNWKLKDAYGLASFFSEQELAIYRCDVKTGEMSHPKFLYPELGGVDAEASPAERRAAAARLFTSPENGRFPRTLVNRIWQRLLGRGFVEPVDDMDAEPWNPDLLDWLASDFVDHQYDVQHLLRQILTSETYRLPAVHRTEGPEREYTFRGPAVRRLTAEQYVDAISTITGEWRVLRPKKAGLGAYSREWQLKSTPLTRALGRPIRDQVFTSRISDATTLQALELVNGETLSNVLHRGAGRMLGEREPPPSNRFDSGDLRTEKVVVDIDITGAKELRLLIEDVDSYDPARVVAGWGNAYLVGPGGVTPLASFETRSRVEKRTLRIQKEDFPASLVAPTPSETVYKIAGKGYTRFRAVVGVDEISLTSEIGPRIRFFVFAEEPDRQNLVRVGSDGDRGADPGGQQPGIAAHRSDTGGRQPENIVTRLYRHAFGRDPSVDERRVAMEFLAPKVTSEGLEDLLWGIFLSPEFQYIN